MYMLLIILYDFPLAHLLAILHLNKSRYDCRPLLVVFLRYPVEGLSPAGRCSIVLLPFNVD